VNHYSREFEEENFKKEKKNAESQGLKSNPESLLQNFKGQIKKENVISERLKCVCVCMCVCVCPS